MPETKKPETKVTALRKYMEHPRVAVALKKICGDTLDAQRLVNIAYQAATRKPELLECTPESIVHCVMQAAQHGLELESPLQHAHAVPFKNSKTQKMDAVFMPGYRGLCHLVRTSDPHVTNIEARVVHAKDKFVFRYGFEPTLEHEPFLRGDPGPIELFYMMVKFDDGRPPHVEHMTLDEVKQVQKKAKAEKGPWSDPQAFPEQGRKTVLKRGLKVLPMSSIVAETIERDNRIETQGPEPADFEIVDPLLSDIVQPESKGAEVRAALGIRPKSPIVESESEKPKKLKPKDASVQPAKTKEPEDDLPTLRLRLMKALNKKPYIDPAQWLDELSQGLFSDVELCNDPEWLRDAIRRAEN